MTCTLQCARLHTLRTNYRMPNEASQVLHRFQSTLVAVASRTIGECLLAPSWPAGPLAPTGRRLQPEGGPVKAPVGRQAKPALSSVGICRGQA
jgi:hypothetical protein